MYVDPKTPLKPGTVVHYHEGGALFTVACHFPNPDGSCNQDYLLIIGDVLADPHAPAAHALLASGWEPGDQADGYQGHVFCHATHFEVVPYKAATLEAVGL